MAVQSLTERLRARAHHTPDAVAYECVELSGQVSAVTYAEVASRATALARELVRCGDGPVLLAYPAGLAYVVAVFAGFLAGRPVVPAYPPDTPSLPDRTRLAGIVADARPAVVVAPRHHPELGVPTVLSVPGAEANDIGWAPPRGATRQDVAVIQYTSGSTGQPRGVLVRHDSIVANTAAIAERFGLTAASRAVTWLPPFHDMGLVGGLLTPMAAGIPIRIIPPGDFLKAPLWWLRQIADTGATTSGGPNFAYDLCVRRARTEEALAGLDLSRWRVAFNGGEPVKPRTLAAFAEKFAPVGFRPDAFLPCYGLAEATLMVTARHWAPTQGGTSAAISCGTPVPGQRVTVVDPDRRVAVDEGVEGEIWIAGPHVTPGYLSGDPAGLFGDLDGTRYLRTGDLGQLRGDELYVTGRAKDVIVFRGENFHAVDVEAAALDATGKVAGTAAAFGVDTDSDPLPVLVLEVRGAADASLAATVRAAVLERTRLRLGLVVLVPPRSVPRTSSGKVRRSACRDALLAGEFDGAMVSDPAVLSALAERPTRQAATAELTVVICGIAAEVCEVADCRPTDSLIDLGMDSVRAGEAAAVLEDALGISVPLDVVLSAATPEQTADALMARWQAEGRPPGLVHERVALADDGVGGSPLAHDARGPSPSES